MDLLFVYFYSEQIHRACRGPLMGPPTGIPWGIPQDIVDIPSNMLDIPWASHGHPMRYFVAILMDISWDIPWPPHGILWASRGHPLGHPMASHGRTVVYRGHSMGRSAGKP